MQGTAATPQQRDDDPPDDSTDGEEDEDDELKQTNSRLSIGMSTLGCTVDNNVALIVDTITAAMNKASAGDWKKRRLSSLQWQLGNATFIMEQYSNDSAKGKE